MPFSTQPRNERFEIVREDGIGEREWKDDTGTVCVRAVAVRIECKYERNIVNCALYYLPHSPLPFLPGEINFRLFLQFRMFLVLLSMYASTDEE